MEQYPDIAPPTVQGVRTYTGASAATVQKAVHAYPLEEGNQRRGKHDVHDLLSHQYRQRYHQRLFQARAEPGYGRRQRTEPRDQGAGRFPVK